MKIQKCYIPNVEKASKPTQQGNNDAPMISKHGSLVRLDAQIVALRALRLRRPRMSWGAGMDMTEGPLPKTLIKMPVRRTNSSVHTVVPNLSIGQAGAPQDHYKMLWSFRHQTAAPPKKHPIEKLSYQFKNSPFNVMLRSMWHCLGKPGQPRVNPPPSSALAPPLFTVR